MLFPKQFNLEIDWINHVTTIYRYPLPLIEYEAYTPYSGLETVSTRAFVKILKQRKYTGCRYVDLMQTMPRQVGQLNFTQFAAYGGDVENGGDANTDFQLAKYILAELQSKYAKVFGDLVFLAVRDNCQLYEHRIQLKDRYADPLHCKIYPIDTHEFEELKETITTWLDSNYILPFNSLYRVFILFA